MHRTQIYLTSEERAGLESLAAARKTPQSVLIREAIDRLLDRSSRSRREEALKRAAGMWKDRKDLPDFRALRREWDRDASSR